MLFIFFYFSSALIDNIPQVEYNIFILQLEYDVLKGVFYYAETRNTWIIKLR